MQKLEDILKQIKLLTMHAIMRVIVIAKRKFQTLLEIETDFMDISFGWKTR
jgi:hypothetical protein